MSAPRPERDEFLVTGQALIDLEKRMALIKRAQGGPPQALMGGTALKISHGTRKED